MEFKEMTVEQLEERKGQILEELDAPEADLDALEEEARGIKEELENRKAAAAKKEEIRSKVARGDGEVIEKIEQEDRNMPTVEEIRDSKEYIDAFANYIKTGNDSECRALLSTNATNGTVAVPTMVYDIVKTAWQREGIMSRVRKAYLRGNLKVGFEISGSDAAAHTEGSGEVSEESLVLGVVELIPTSIKKWISFSDEALDMTADSFLAYVYDELAYRIAKKAADTLVEKILACGTVSTTTSPAVPAITAEVGMGTVAQAIANLSDEAANPTVIMNKLTWGAFKAAQYDNNYAADPFEGCDVVFSEKVKAYSAASTGDTYAIVGDLDHGALANFPNGDEITFKFDEITLATSDLVKVIGREFVAVGVVAPNAFCAVKK